MVKYKRTRGTVLLCAVWLSVMMIGCGGPKYTIDDGRKVDEKLLANIRALGNGAQAIRPAITKSAALQDKECDTQWELPFDVATSYDLKEDDRVAWVRALQADERLTVVGAAEDIDLIHGDKIVEIDGYHNDNTTKMLKELMDWRDSGKRFNIKTADGKIVSVSPLSVCRGHVALADPETAAELQDYHWLQSVHPLEAFKKPLTSDEALWVVLWTQGLSEEGGVRMKTYQYGLTTIKTIVNIATVVSGVGAAARAAQAASTSVASAAGSAAAKAAAETAAKEVAQQIGRSVSKDVAEAAYKFARKEMIDVLQAAALNRMGLGGVSWVAGTVFDRADKWAFERMAKLGADPLAALSLNLKLAEAGATHNAFVFDEERLTQMTALATSAGIGDKFTLLLNGKPAESAIADEAAPGEGVSIQAMSTPGTIEARPIESTDINDVTEPKSSGAKAAESAQSPDIQISHLDEKASASNSQ